MVTGRSGRPGSAGGQPMTDLATPVALTRIVDGNEVPVPGKLAIDATHSTVEFVSRHMLTKARGRFTDYDAEVQIAERPEDSTLRVTIQAASIESGLGQRDEHLTSADFL